MQKQINSITSTTQRIAKATTPPVDLREVETLCHQLERDCKALEKACG